MVWDHEVAGSNPASRSARMVWDHEVAGSNPATPTNTLFVSFLTKHHDMAPTTSHHITLARLYSLSDD